MFRIVFICIAFVTHYLVESVVIEYPHNKQIEERIRKDIDSIDSIFRYYIVPREIQFHASAITNGLPYFLLCKGSQKSINLTVPISAVKDLSLTTDDKTHTITAKLHKNQSNINLVGRYTCSEIIKDKNYETTVHVFIRDKNSVFTKSLHSKIFKQTGIHFFNIPCQTTNWYPKMSCPMAINRGKCKLRKCNLRERQRKELECDLPLCDEQDRCIPVYYTPSDLKPKKVFFDPQIGFALENPTIPNGLTDFTCRSNYTLSKEVKIPFDSSPPDYVRIHQSSLSIMSDETLRLSCEIQYGTKINRKMPTLFWFEDIYNLNLILNHTEKPVFNLKTQVYNRNSSITLRGFKPKHVYRFYCVRVSDHGLYSHSIDIRCVNTPVLDVEIDLNESNVDKKLSYGSSSVYDISIYTVPRSSVIIELSRDGISLANDKRFEILSTNNQENQYFEYVLKIHNITYEDEKDLKITVKSSLLEKTEIIKPTIIGDPVGQFSFTTEQEFSAIPWRDETNLRIYSYGVSEYDSYRIVCTIRHRSDIKQPLNVYIQYSTCSIDDCLSNLIDKTCQISSRTTLMKTISNPINNYQTQFVSNHSHKLTASSIGHQYLCCYQENGLINIAKGITILSRNHNMFYANRPEFSLVKGDILTYSCEGHQLIYNNLQMIYNDGYSTYERTYFDNEWHLKGTNQVKRIDIRWNSTIKYQYIRTMKIEVKTSPLEMTDNNKYFQCIGLSKQTNIIPNAKDTYSINIDNPLPLQFKNYLQTVSHLNRKSGDNVEFDCKFDGRPKPKVSWFKGKVHLNNQDSTLKLADNNESITINRLQASDTGYYTCELNNGHDRILRRSFDLRVQGTNTHSKFGRLTGIFVLISSVIVLMMLILLITVGTKYFQMKRIVNKSIFSEHQSIGPEDKSQSAMSQLTRIPLPDNFASTHQIRTLLGYVNGDDLPATSDDFKELGRGQFGVVYQVRLPEVGLVAAKTLPDTIRQIKHGRNKSKKNHDWEENQGMISNHEIRKKKAAEMLIDEIKVMNKAGKHVNIVALKKVAYPETRFKLLFHGGPIRDEDSFYLMELCARGSLENLLKNFPKSSSNSSQEKLSLYETLSKQPQLLMTVHEAYERCILTVDDLKLAAYQVARGVDYLNRRQIAHCDIAARNVLVDSRYIMKICDFGLATWTTYKNYREQFTQNHSVQLEKKNSEIATHNLTPELAKAFLCASTPDERLLLNKASIKADVWSFGIFLWTLFLKCRIRPFNKLLEEIKRNSKGEDFFHQLASVINEGHVLHYIDYQPEIPRNIYAIIRECLVEENHRPEMTRIRAFLYHSKMLSKQPFEYYRSEYNRYQEENATDENVEYFGEDQGVSNLPSFEDDNGTNDNDDSFPPASKDDGYPSPIDNSRKQSDSYLVPINDNPRITTNTNNSKEITTKPNIPQVDIQPMRPTRPAPPPPI
ncbi:unnamed protein product [Rotaria socialis]|uniref:Receptor protein-tyrosine kinase n=1 Tax=Rotaria socialis TaxID=392032 RepID=A0A817Y2J1_9BILA|nr:unnamed protein product [Rotaria socialis]